MKKVYTSDDRMMAGHVKSLLEEDGIPCLVKNEALAGAIGEIPPIECWPEVWITDDDDYDRAREIIQELLIETATPKAPWRCQCGEEIEGQFHACWQCGRERPD